MSDPDADCRQLNRGEEVVVAFVVAGCDGAKVFEFVEEALDAVAVAIKTGAERGAVLAVGHELDIGPGPRAAIVILMASLS